MRGKFIGLLLLIILGILVIFAAGYIKQPKLEATTTTLEWTAGKIWEDLQSKFKNTKDCMDIDCFEKIALRTNNYRICEEIPAPIKSPVRNYCYFTVAVKTRNQSLCENIENLGTYADIDKNYCRALASRDISLCKEVSSDDFKGYCNINLLMDTAAKTGNLTICEQLGIEHIEYKNSCYIKVALFSNDERICDYIPTDESLANRIANIECKAMVRENSSVCEVLDNVVDRDNCFSKVAYVKQDISICDKIERYFIKQECVEEIFIDIPFDCMGCTDLREEIYHFK
jgi:hypothetical protein